MTGTERRLTIGLAANALIAVGANLLPALGVVDRWTALGVSTVLFVLLAVLVTVIQARAEGRSVYNVVRRGISRDPQRWPGPED